MERQIKIRKQDDTQRRQEISLLTILVERHPEKARELVSGRMHQPFDKWKDGDSGEVEQP